MSEIAKYSNAIADKLLKGWTLLDEHCPVTGAVPLLQSLDGHKWSAATNSFIEESPRSGGSAGGMDSDGDSAEKSRGKVENSKSSAASAVAAPAEAKSNELKKVEEHRNTDDSLESRIQNVATQTIEALLAKIDAAGRLLQSTRDVTKSHALASLITECGSAIKALRAASASE